MKRDEIKKLMQMMGRKGGQTTLARHGKKKMTEWGKLGGRPKGTGKKKAKATKKGGK